jgi:hypothetical protein
MTVERLEREMSAQEFSHWEYLRWREPWGPYRWDFLVGLIRLSLAAQWASKDSPLPSLKDFIPQWDPVPEKSREDWEREADEEWERSTAKLFA